MINYSDIEKKWQLEWANAKVFEPEPGEKPSLLVTSPFPYVNTPQHIGHLKTYSTADTYSRYMRMKGFNVLYPMAFHMTGTPILGIAKRIANKDEDLLKDFRNLYRIPEEDIAKMNEPLYLAVYFANNHANAMQLAGYGIDWRRKFTSINPLFSKFVEWQFMNLKKMGYLVQGKHPVGWCTNENNAVGQNDTLHDMQPKIEEITAIKFKDTASNIFFPCATYRPETIYGVTNIFIKENGAYVIADINGEQYYISKDAAAALALQAKVEIKGEINANELLSKKAINPVTKEEVPIFPGFFVKTDFGTGVVMSVPAHAPFDYAAIERLKMGGYAPAQNVQYKKIIEVKDFNAPHSDIPALAYLGLLNADPNAMDDTLELATKAIYKEESHRGIMLVGKYQGRPEPEARDGLKQELSTSKDAITLFILNNPEPVICRCGTRVVVKVVDDQWFINYGDEKWKEKVRATLPKIRLLPEDMRRAFNSAAEWIDLRAAERAQGLGTPFPFNPSHIIESLSDSTIYTAFYTFIHILNNSKVTADMLKPEFFDYVINGQGSLENVSSLTRIDTSTVQKSKESFEYWYINTSRHTAREHISSHLIMYIFNHAALLPEKFYPKQIAVNGMLLVEGEKMSKSLNNTIPLIDALAMYGADPMRYVEVAGSDLESDADFTVAGINGIKSKNEYLFEMVDKMNAMKGIELEHMDYWLYSKLNTKIKTATAAMDICEFRIAYTEIFYNTITELKWYTERGGHNQVVVREVLESVALMLAPVMPHFAEEFWHIMGNTNLVAQAKWPVADETMINNGVEEIEKIISNTIEDINHTLALTSKIDANKGKKVKEIRIIIAEQWKVSAYNLLVETQEMSKVLRAPELDAIDKEKISKYLSQFMKKIVTLYKMPEIKTDDLYVSFIGSGEYIKNRLQASIILEKESASKSPRASRALPDKPSIDITWG